MITWTKLRKNKFLGFMTLWMIPSATFLYVVFHDMWGMGIINAYFWSNVLSGLVFYLILETGWKNETKNS